MEEKEAEYNETLMEINISNIRRDTERLKIAKQLTIDAQEDEPSSSAPKDDDNLDNYTLETEEGVKVLDSTSSINRKAIFHDLGRIKSWRESLDKPKEDGGHDGLSLQETISEEHASIIMEKNIDSVLGELPDLHDKTSCVSDGAEKRLCEIENKINCKHLDVGKKI